MLELEGVPFVLLFGFWIWCVFDVINTDDAAVRNLPKLVWVFIVLIFPDIGAIAWLVAGRPKKAFMPTFTYGNQRAAAPRGPDDDVDFLQRVDRERNDRLRDAELELHRREAELQEREERLRRREEGLGPDA